MAEVDFGEKVEWLYFDQVLSDRDLKFADIAEEPELLILDVNLHEDGKLIDGNAALHGLHHVECILLELFVNADRIGVQCPIYDLVIAFILRINDVLLKWRLRCCSCYPGRCTGMRWAPAPLLAPMSYSPGCAATPGYLNSLITFTTHSLLSLFLNPWSDPSGAIWSFMPFFNFSFYFYTNISLIIILSSFRKLISNKCILQLMWSMLKVNKLKKLSFPWSYRCSIFLLADDLIKLIESEELIWLCLIQNVSIVHHLCNLLIIHSLAQLPGDILHLLEINKSNPIGVIECKQFAEPIFWLGITQSITNYLEELLEI